MKAHMETTLNLALALEGSAAPASDEIKRLAGIADMLETLPDPDIDPRFIARLEATLMAEFDAQAPASEIAAPVRPGLRLVKPQPISQQPIQAQPRIAPNVIALPRRRFVVRKALVSAIAAAMLMALPVVASASALPGSPFFGIEQWRQNHAISQTHGVERAFAMEKVARKWIGYGAEMVALGYPAARIDEVLQRAGLLQTQAVKVISAYGSADQIRRFAGMLAADVKRLDRVRKMAPGHARPALDRAIGIAQDLTDQLARELGLSGLPAAASGLGAVATGTEPATGGSSSTATTGSSTDSAKPGSNGSKDPQPPTTIQNPVDVQDQCDILFSEQLGDWLAGPSVVICKSEDLGDN